MPSKGPLKDGFYRHYVMVSALHKATCLSAEQCSGCVCATLGQYATFASPGCWGAAQLLQSPWAGLLQALLIDMECAQF